MTPPDYHHPTQVAPYARPRTNGKAIASFILGLSGLLFFPLIPSIIAVVLGKGARREIRTDPYQTGDGFAVTGVVLGWIPIILIAFVALIFLFMLLLAVFLGGAVE